MGFPRLQFEASRGFCPDHGCLMKGHLPLSIALHPDRAVRGKASRRAAERLTAYSISYESDVWREFADAKFFYFQRADDMALHHGQSVGLIEGMAVADSVKSSAINSAAASLRRTSGSVSRVS
jgi:hypothetical protein